MNILEIVDVSCGYGGPPVLHNLSLSIRKGEVLAVIGQNGCGKSTLLKTAARIISNNSGSVRFKNMEIGNLQAWDMKRLGITYFAQGGMTFPTMTVRQHLDLALRGHSEGEAIRIEEECLSYFPSLTGLMNELGGNLSGGERQKLSFAMLSAQQTECWLLDEPTAGLDPDAVRDSVHFLREMKSQTSKTMLLVEHNYSVAFELADRVAVLTEGCLTRVSPKIEFDHPDFLEKWLFN